MTPTARIVRLACVIGGVLVACLGCSSTDPQHLAAGGTLGSLPQGTAVGREQVEALLAQLTRLRAASQEALDAATAIGTTENELSAAQQALRFAEQSWQEGYRAYEAGQYEGSWEKLQGADLAFRRAEEYAVRAGLSHIEYELAQAYPHTLVSGTRRSGGRSDAVRVVQEGVTLRDGAGLTYHIIGKARLGQLLQVLAEAEEWYRVRTEQGVVGWVSKASVVRVH